MRRSDLSWVAVAPARGNATPTLWSCTRSYSRYANFLGPPGARALGPPNRTVGHHVRWKSPRVYHGLRKSSDLR
eukprot:scaffold83230_cov62-Phaeocystis_antarctica.AAC.8